MKTFTRLLKKNKKNAEQAKSKDMNVSPDLKSENLINAYNIITRHAWAPKPSIDVITSPENLEKLRQRVETTWIKLGEDDAHWSVITSEDFRKKNLHNNLNEFFQKGEYDVRFLETVLNRSGTSLSNFNSVMDFGCGVGRLSLALAKHAKHVIGVDISTSHLQEAQKNIDSLEIGNVSLNHIKNISDISRLHKVDLVYSLIVLQHNPPPVMREILIALCQRVAPGGYLFVQLPTYRKNYHYNVESDLDRSADKMEMHILPQAEVFKVFEQESMSLLEITEDWAPWALDFTSHCFLSKKRT